MAKNYSRCGKQLSFRDSFVWDKKPVCGVCLKSLEQEQKREQLSDQSDDKTIEKTTSEKLKGPLGFVSTFIGVLIWGGSTAIFSTLS